MLGSSFHDEELLLALPPGVRRLKGVTGASHWDVAIRAPSARLRPFVYGDYMGYTEWAPSITRRREFPVPFAVMVVEFGPPLRLMERGDQRRVTSHRGGFVGGLCEDFVVCEHDGYQQGIQVNLTPIGARLLLGLPMSDLSGCIIPIGDALPARHRRLGERLSEASGWETRFDLLDDTLADCLHEASDRTRVVSWAVRRIEESGGAVSVRLLSRELGYSEKHVIAMFRDQVGIPPKLLARIVRLDCLLEQVRSGGAGWSALGPEVGFYDQAHLVREVRRLPGVAPTQARGMVADIASLLA